MKKERLLLLLFVITNITVFAQKGTIRGTVTDAETGETLPFSNIYLEGNTAVGTTTDLDGNYTLKLNVGTHTVVYSFTSFKDKKETVEIKTDEIVVMNIALSTQAEVLDAVEVVAERTKAKTVAAFDMMKKKSINMIDGTSSEMMAKTGDGDAGEVMKRVTGVSVEGGKHVYVRGLGDRYTKTILNGMEIPGLDPDRNNVQMDIFPTNLIDNIVVYKTFTPDLQGDFTGGMIDIQTKDFPNTKTIQFSAGFGFNTQATFNKNFFLYEGSSTDFLGFDNGSRALPFSIHTKIPDPTRGDPKLTQLTSSFDPTMGTSDQNNFLNQSYSFSVGNQKNFEKIDYGYTFALNYQNGYTFNTNTHDNPDRNLEYGVHFLHIDRSSDELLVDKTSSGSVAENNVIWSALIAQSIKINKKHKFSLTGFHTQNGRSTAAELITVGIENPSILHKQSLQYTQRSVSNLNLSGKNYLNKFEVNWSLSPTVSSIDDPDVRSAILELNPDLGVFELNRSVGAELRRIYRTLSETNYSGKVDVTYTTKQWDSLDTKIKFGLLSTFKERDFRILQYLFDYERGNSFEFEPNWFLQPENIWQPDTRVGTYVRGAREEANTFTASQRILAGYVMNELPIIEKFNVIYGLRVEHVLNKYTGQNNTGSLIFKDSTLLDELDFLPALNLVYNVIDKKGTSLNLRGSYSRTLARPSFREISVSQIYDPIQGRRYVGNTNLKETHIQNFDLRLEYFFGKTETISLSGFYKQFNNPIEVVAFEIAPTEITQINAGFADIIGVEFDVRKQINIPAWFDQEYKRITVGSNITLVKSRVDMNEVIIPGASEDKTQKEIKEESAREGETIEDFRPMYGQSPYILNLFLGFANDSAAIDCNLSYNVQGKRLAVIGVGRTPDVFEQPFHSLNFKASKKFGATNQWKISVAAQNILGQTKRRLYENFGVESRVFDAFYDGRTFSATVAYVIK